MQLHVICGLPRSGSTLLCNILNQNPAFHATSTSCLPGMVTVLSQVMSRSPEIKGDLARDRKGTEERQLRTFRAMIAAWHRDTRKKITFDKSRGWNARSLELKKLYPKAKMIITVRDLREVFASMEKQHRKNPLFRIPIPNDTQMGYAIQAFEPNTGMIGGPLTGIRSIIQRHKEFEDYFVWKHEDFCADPEQMIERLYCFLGEDPFEHDLENIENTATDLDALFHHKFPHDGSGSVRPAIESWPNYIGQDVAREIVQAHKWFFQRFNYIQFRRPIALRQQEQARVAQQ